MHAAAYVRSIPVEVLVYSIEQFMALTLNLEIFTLLT